MCSSLTYSRFSQIVSLPITAGLFVRLTSGYERLRQVPGYNLSYIKFSERVTFTSFPVVQPGDQY
jgi:hypothetical protein